MVAIMQPSLLNNPPEIAARNTQKDQQRELHGEALPVAV
jgi:hypothetical protein